MDNNHFINLDESNIEKERPTFLTVLCIITFVVSGIWFLSSFFNVLTYDEVLAEEQMEIGIVAMEEAFAEQDSNPMSDRILDSFIEMGQDQMLYHGLIGWVTVLSVLLSLIGAFFMFRMNKIGFHVYLVSKIVGLIPLLVISINFMVVASYVLMGIFTIAFVVMYAVNLKHMKTA